MTGGAKCVANLKIKSEMLEAGYKTIITQWANEVLRQSQMMCPVDTGTLRRSGRVTTLSSSPLKMQIGYTAEYAIYVHEIPANHPVGQWKYLSTPFEQMVPQLQTMLRAGAAL